MAVKDRILEALATIASVFAGLGLWILDRICPRIQAGRPLPYGFSLGKERGLIDTEVFRLLLPVTYWRKSDYLACMDAERHGWWLITVMVAVLRVPGGFDVRFRAGSWARGYGKVKSTMTGPDWLDEHALRNGLGHIHVASP